MMDSAGRAYRDGGGLLGGSVAFDWATQALAKLAPGGAMLLYTGVAFTSGESPLITALESLARKSGASLDLQEIDPDVFGEELSQPSYGDVERIAAIGALLSLN